MDIRHFGLSLATATLMSLAASAGAAEPTSSAADAPATPAAQSCPSDMFHAALKATDTISGWGQLHTLSQRYAPCDKGAVAANFTYNITTGLIAHWDKALDLAKLTYSDKAFGPFIAAHINGQLSPEQSARLTDLAKNHCPAGGKPLCARLLDSLYDNEVVRRRFRMAN